jgi:hypothetical protein
MEFLVLWDEGPNKARTQTSALLGPKVRCYPNAPKKIYLFFLAIFKGMHSSYNTRKTLKVLSVLKRL